MRFIESKNDVLITDGAMGTYYNATAKHPLAYCELANTLQPDMIFEIHQAYIEAGARLIRTNTFAANEIALNVGPDQVRKVIQSGYEIAKNAAAERDVLVGASIGPIPSVNRAGTMVGAEVIAELYRGAADAFLEAGAEVFVFETFGDPEDLIDVTEHIRKKRPDAAIIVQFAMLTEGTTRKGLTVKRLIQAAQTKLRADVYGFNCGIGPLHMLRLLEQHGHEFNNTLISALPNAGYPTIVNERTLYTATPEYFAQTMKQVRDMGVQILGGCCGTTPAHIAVLSQALKENRSALTAVRKKAQSTAPRINAPSHQDNPFQMKLERGDFVFAVELTAPSDTAVGPMLRGAETLKRAGVDIVTLPDSPMARMHADSLAIAAKIRREAQIEALPHLCCRDRNLISLQASLLAAHIEGIRNVLIVTGDPVPETSRGEVKSVFNANAFQLIQLATDMNQGVFASEPLLLGGALNLNVRHRERELARMYRKIERGARFFLTQPIFDDEVIDFVGSGVERKSTKLLAGLMPVVSYRNAQFINNELPGIHIPERHLALFDPEMTREEAQAAAIGLTLDLAGRLKPYVDGFYLITPFARYEMLAEIVEKIKAL